ncbi:hypothetical protein A3709_00140 [Halioglobus sp. HI00S01]|uniref:heme ABC transporter ATP-binding protein n=1 Tax=Halioglobus sp. HI00S01 TaxID=1822214 RepID=UPI0007C20D1A|nr:heme ABC transporter ATP-binding protein [Halioglobus sp. HI00S01]KZX60523.1 hypothetical protein A3709_00140 [Halioglobus sp. HI00S01]
MLHVHDLKFSRGREFTLQVADWRASPGHVQAVLGTNGAGKSTFLKLLCGEEAPTGGDIRLHGQRLQDWSALERARHLGVLPQASSLSFAFSAEEVVSLGLTPLNTGWRNAQQTVRAVMRATDCAHLAKKPYPRLSGGERQRIHLARVLVQLSQAEHAPVLLLDEPTSAQDLGQQHRMLELASGLAREHNYAVVAILHDLNLTLRHTTHCLHLDAGRSVAQGAPQEVLSTDSIAKYWGYNAQLLHTADGALVVA